MDDWTAAHAAIWNERRPRLMAEQCYGEKAYMKVAFTTPLSEQEVRKIIDGHNRTLRADAQRFCELEEGSKTQSLRRRLAFAAFKKIISAGMKGIGAIDWNQIAISMRHFKDNDTIALEKYKNGSAVISFDDFYAEYVKYASRDENRIAKKIKKALKGANIRVIE